MEINKKITEIERSRPNKKERDEVQLGTDMSMYGLTQNMRNVQSPMD